MAIEKESERVARLAEIENARQRYNQRTQAAWDDWQREIKEAREEFYAEIGYPKNRDAARDFTRAEDVAARQANAEDGPTF